MANKYSSNTKYAKKYRTTNWSEYNRYFIQRGHFAIFISDDVMKAWKPIATKRRRGGQTKYSNPAIELGLKLRHLFTMGQRQTESFMRSLADFAKINIPVPHDAMRSRRAATFCINPLPIRTCDPTERVTLIVDSTGLKMVGEREQQSEKYKLKGGKTWRKRHLGIDSKGFIIFHKLTTNMLGDGSVAEAWLDQIENDIGNFMGDGAYDRRPRHEKQATHNKGAPPKVMIPLRKDAVLSKDPETLRDRHIQYLKDHGKKMGTGNQKRAEEFGRNHDVSMQGSDRKKTEIGAIRQPKNRGSHRG